MSAPAFGFHTTAEEVITAFGSSIAGKTILITGPTPGSLGATTVERLASHPTYKPAHFILLGRSEEKTQPLITKIHELSSETKTTFVPIELTSVDSIRKAASSVLALNTKIDTIIANAGVMALKDYTLSTDGIESQFAINHLSHFLLTNLLLPTLSSNARIINMSSEGHALGRLNVPSTPVESWTQESVKQAINYDNGKNYDLWKAYGQSKGSQILSSLAFAKRLASSSKYSSITANAVHPGMIFGTGLGTHLSNEDVASIGKEFEDAGRPTPGIKNLEEGLSTALAAVLDERLATVSGKYLVDCGVGEQAEWCKSEQTAEKLWIASEILVGEKFDF